MPDDPECIVEDAQLFGRVQHGGDWLMAYLVARNVEKHSGGGGPRVEMPGPSKVSARHFADLSGVSNRTVGEWLDVWNWAAEQHLTYSIEGVDEELPLSELLVPGDETGEWSLTVAQLAALNDQRDWKQMRKNWAAQKKLERAGIKQTRETLDETIHAVGLDEPDAEIVLDDEALQPQEGDYDVSSDPAFVEGESVEDVPEESGPTRADAAMARARRRMDEVTPTHGGVVATVADWRAGGNPRQVVSRRFGTIERELHELLVFVNDQEDFDEDTIRSYRSHIDTLASTLAQLEKLLVSEMTGQTATPVEG